MKNYIEPTPDQQLGILYQIRQHYGIIADGDTYKLSHMPQYIKGADKMVSYFESRGGIRDKVLNFGAQMIAKEYFLQRLTKRQVKNMITWANKHMNGNMVKDLQIALDAVVDELDGKIPIRIRNAPEGFMIPINNVILTIETTLPDPRWFSLVSYFETKLVRVWSPMTVGTTTFYVRKTILKALELSCDYPMEVIDWMFHDFGSRGTGGMEVSAFAGAAHLVNSRGTDNSVAVHALEFGYNEPMAGNSIAASEHSTTTTHGPEGEFNLVSQMFDAYANPGAIFATVIDSYDAIRFLRKIVPQFKDRLIASGAKWIIRPDSGDPITMPIQCVIELEKIFGCTVNKKGYKVLNHVGVIQGDGIVPEQVTEILNKLMALGYSAENISFGMGGGLLQKNDRDTHKFALKCSAVRVNGEWIDVYKDPAVYDEDWNKIDEVSFKSSKRGRLELLYNKITDEWKTVRIEEIPDDLGDWKSMLETVMEDAHMVRDMTLTECRINSGMMTA